MVFDIGLFHVCECWLCWLTVTYILGYDHNFCVLGNCWHSQSVSDSWQTFLGINESHWFCLGCWSLTVGLEPILAFIEQELGYSLDRLPMYRRPSPNTQIYNIKKDGNINNVKLLMSRWPCSFYPQSSLRGTGPYAMNWKASTRCYQLIVFFHENYDELEYLSQRIISKTANLPNYTAVITRDLFAECAFKWSILISKTASSDTGNNTLKRCSQIIFEIRWYLEKNSSEWDRKLSLYQTPAILSTLMTHCYRLML